MINKMNLAVATLAALIGTAAHAGDFTELKLEDKSLPKSYAFTGEIVPGDSQKLEQLATSNSQLIVVISSPGGNFIEGIKLGAVTQKYNSKLNIYIDQAFSAAGLWAIADDHPKFLSDDSILGLHMAFNPNGLVDPGDEQLSGFIMGRYLEDVLGGIQPAMELMGKMAEARKYGTQAMVVLTANSNGWQVVVPKN